MSWVGVGRAGPNSSGICRALYLLYLDVCNYFSICFIVREVEREWEKRRAGGKKRNHGSIEVLADQVKKSKYLTLGIQQQTKFAKDIYLQFLILSVRKKYISTIAYYMGVSNS